MAASTDLALDADKKVGASADGVDATNKKVDATNERAGAAGQRVGATEKNGEPEDENVQWRNDLVDASAGKDNSSSVKALATMEQVLGASKNAGASKKKPLSTEKKAFVATGKWMFLHCKVYGVRITLPGLVPS